MAKPIFHWGIIDVESFYRLLSISFKCVFGHMSHALMPDIKASRCRCSDCIHMMSVKPVKACSLVSFRYGFSIESDSKRCGVKTDDGPLGCKGRGGQRC